MRPYRLIPLVVALLVVPAAAAAQESVEIVVGEGFADPLPLEVPFRVVGRAPVGVERIEFAYAPAPGSPSGYLPVGPPQAWLRTVDDEFSFAVWPLQHGIHYRFEWRMTLTVRALERQRPGAAERATEALLDRAGGIERGGLGFETVAAIEEVLVEALVGSEPPSGSRLRLDAAQVDRLVAAVEQVRVLEREFAANHGALCRELPDLLAGEEGASLAGGLRTLLASADTLGPEARLRWQAVVDPRDRNNGTRVEDGVRLLLWLREEPSLLAEILAGERTTHRESLLEVAPASHDDELDGLRCEHGVGDSGALGVLAETLRVAAALSAELVPEPASGALELAPRLARELRAYRDDAIRLTAARTATRQRVEEGLERLALETSLEWVATATAVVGGDHPHVGLDLGVGWVPAFDGTVFYTAAHLYAVPVNRSASLGIHRGADVLLKRLSLMAGMAVTGVEGDGRQDGAGPGSPMLGLGLRITRHLRGGGGLLWYRDPAGETRRAWFASLSLDIDLAAFLGRTGRLFGG